MNNSHPEHTGVIPRINAWFLQRSSDRYNRLTNKRKRSLFAGLSGWVLEIGPGTGSNLEYYPDEVLLTGLEPNPHMQQYLREKAGKLGRQLEIITGSAEEIPLEDESMDAVVSTLVLCSVPDVQQTLHEIKRVLKPGGSFLFMEHVAAPKGTLLRIIQQGIKPLWKWVADGCRPDRETWKAIKEAGFDEVTIEQFQLALPVVKPHIVGKTIKKTA